MAPPALTQEPAAALWTRVKMQAYLLSASAWTQGHESHVCAELHMGWAQGISCWIQRAVPALVATAQCFSTNNKAKALSKSEDFLWCFPSPKRHEGWTVVAQGCPHSEAGLTSTSERLFVFLIKGSALLTEETALQATQALLQLSGII